VQRCSPVALDGARERVLLSLPSPLHPLLLRTLPRNGASTRACAQGWTVEDLQRSHGIPKWDKLFKEDEIPSWKEGMDGYSAMMTLFAAELGSPRHQGLAETRNETERRPFVT
jgi:hypothetical protein